MLKQAIVVLLLGVTLIGGIPTKGVPSNQQEQQLEEDPVARSWEDFKETFEREYEEDEEQRRFEIFRDNLDKIEKLNADPNNAATFGINQFTDWHPDLEFGSKMGFTQPSKKLNRPSKLKVGLKANSDTIDWRESGVVSAIKDQGYCGSCWAFSSVETVESAYAMKYGNLPSLSEQQLVSCDSEDDGCDGGNPIDAYEYIASEGLMTAQEYPYTSGVADNSGSCYYSAEEAESENVYVDAWDFAIPYCEAGDCEEQAQFEDHMAAQLEEIGPLSIIVNSGDWQHYTGGVWTADCAGGIDDLDHAVAVVGFTTDAWIVRNSWGTSWGDQGYIYLERGSNLCGVADFVTYATVL